MFVFSEVVSDNATAAIDSSSEIETPTDGLPSAFNSFDWTKRTNNDKDMWVFPSNTSVVRYCFAEEVTKRCMLQVSKTLIIIVTATNLIKLLMMLATLRFTRRPIMNIGDAVSSFLLAPDSQTAGRYTLPMIGEPQVAELPMEKGLAKTKGKTLPQLSFDGKRGWNERGLLPCLGL